MDFKVGPSWIRLDPEQPMDPQMDWDLGNLQARSKPLSRSCSSCIVSGQIVLLGRQLPLGSVTDNKDNKS